MVCGMSSFNASELLRHGVSPSKVGVPANTQLSAIDFLCTRFPAIHREVWQQRFDAHSVLNAKGEHMAPSDSLLGESHLLYFRHVVDEPTLPFKAQIIFQDDHLVVADKPHFMPVTPGGQFVQQSLLVQLKQQLNLPELSPVHRIDRETAGLVVLSVRAQDRDAYQSLFRLRQVEKTYEAIAGAPAGAYWDGGITDYHLHLDYRQAKGLTLYPHFQKAVVPGWLDKKLTSRHHASAFLDSTVLLAPDPDWVRTLPNGKLPDRTDFTTYGQDMDARVKVWKQAVGEAERLADELADWLLQPDFGRVEAL